MNVMTFKNYINAILHGAHFNKTNDYIRKTRLYCVGTAKSGTHSIDAMFSEEVRSAHEPDNKRVIQKILDISSGKVERNEIIKFIRERDKKLCLDVDSSQLNFFLIEYLIEEFPESLFLLTIRDCYTWLDSFINHSLARKTNRSWKKLRELRFQSNRFKHGDEEEILKSKGLYTLEGYLSYWSSHNEKVLTVVPHDRLLVVKTNEITQRVNDIVRFSGLSKKMINVQHTHSFKNPNKYNLLRKIDREYLENKVQKYCSSIMNIFYPELKRMEDSGL